MTYRMLSKKDVGKATIAIGIGSYALAFVQYLETAVPNEHDRWGFLKTTIYNNLGNEGIIALWVLLGTFLIYKGWSGARKNN